MLEALSMGFMANPEFNSYTRKEIAENLGRTETAIERMRYKLNRTNAWDIAPFKTEVSSHSSHS